MMSPTPHLPAFLACERGSVMTFWALSFGVLLGFLALSFDFGRIAATQSEVQSYVDAVALAAAGELDGRADAIARATDAAAQMIADRQTFGAGAAELAGAGGALPTGTRAPPSTAKSPSLNCTHSTWVKGSTPSEAELRCRPASLKLTVKSADWPA